MKVLIKIGGTLLEDAESRTRVASQIAEISRSYQAVVVHGGGKQVTRFLEQQGIESQFIDGLRVSDAAVIDGVTKVIAGTVNKAFVSALAAAGSTAVGISGVDGGLTTAAQLSPKMQLVGKPIKSDGRLLDVLVNARYLPVVACIAGDAQGRIYNVNADQMAVSCAVGWRAQKLFFLTDVPGVKGQSGEVIHSLHPDLVRSLIEAGIATGGMQAKLEAAVLAVNSGVEEVVIGPGAESDICRRLLLGESIGTRLYSKAEQMA